MGELSNKCNSYFYTDLSRKDQNKAQTYFMQKMGYPDKEGSFGKEIGLLKYLFRIPFVNKIMI